MMFDIISPLFLSEVSQRAYLQYPSIYCVHFSVDIIVVQALKKLDVKKEEISSITDGIRRRAAPDLEIIAVRFSTAVFRRPSFFSCMIKQIKILVYSKVY